MRNALDIAVAGAGPAGLAAALYLSRIEEIIAVTGDYLASRRVRGGLAVSAQFLGIRLAEMQTEVACAHALIGNAAREKQAGSGQYALTPAGWHALRQHRRLDPD